MFFEDTSCAGRWVTIKRILLTVLLGSQVACQTPPPAGGTGGRIDPYRTTAADLASTSVNMPALLEFSDQTAESLARDVKHTFQNHQSQVILELGYLNNKTRSSGIDFEMMQHRVRSHLLKSITVQDNILIVANPQRMDSEQRRLYGSSEDLLQEGEERPPSDRYDPNITYLLSGDFYESNRGGTRRYLFTFNVVNLQRRNIVFQQSYDLAQQ